MSGVNQWNESLFGCFDDWKICCYGYWCLPCLFGTNAEKIKGDNCVGMCCAYSLLASCALSWLPHCYVRQAFREKYNLVEDPSCGDCLTTFCCGPCAICQEARELQSREGNAKRYQPSNPTITAPPMAIQEMLILMFIDEVTLALRLLHYKNRNGLTYENRPCDTKYEHDINRDGRCDTAFLFCLVRLPFQNPHNCTLGDYFTDFVGADDIHFINVNQPQQRSSSTSLLNSIWYQPVINFHFKYPKTGVGLIVEVFDIDDANNHTIHDSIDFYGRTLVDLNIYPSKDSAKPQRLFLRSLFGAYTNLTADFSLYCSSNYFGTDCEIFCLPNAQRYDCDSNTGQKLCKHGYFGQDCLSDVRACEDEPCLNNGTCVVYLRSYLCQCQKGFMDDRVKLNSSFKLGSTVRIFSPTCDRMNCMHGYCSKDGKCVCYNGWTSENCNESFISGESGCSSRPCLHNATCETLTDVNPASAYRCHCRSGYTGRNCEIAMVHVCERMHCIHGQCFKIDFDTEICVCKKNWTGIDCSQPLFLPTTKTKLIRTTKSMKIIKNLTDVSSQNNIHNYLDFLNTRNTIKKNISLAVSPVTASTIYPNYKYKSPCTSKPCLHNSTCVAQSEHNFQCICSPSFIGVYCEIEQNPCESSPCQHQSLCITKSNQHIQCLCRPHFTGKFCEYPVPFHMTPYNEKCNRVCQNGGVCLIDETNQEQCICKPSYTGHYCESLKSNCTDRTDPSCYIDPCKSNPCLSNGTCHMLLSSKNYICSCPEQYTGNRCESEMNSNSSKVFATDSNSDNDDDDDDDDNNSTSNLWPLAIVFGYVFSLMLVFIIIWFLWYGLTIRPQSYTPYGERVSNDRYQPYRLGVSNPLFFTNQEYITPISTTLLTPPTTISNLDQWTRTITR
ncbi:hypothetical protein I4U23_000735 [Adineta vaga]|nr:hypothetical protein I4U23_000735 [Adineta vaga]